MNTRGEVALAVGAGYLFGRTRRMKAALMLAAAGAGRYPGGPRVLLQRGARVLAESPEVARLGESIRQDLMAAAKAAAITAASQRIDSLNERLRTGTDEVTEDVTGAVRGTSRRAPAVAELSPDDDYEDDYDDEDSEERNGDSGAPAHETTVRRRPVARRRVSGEGRTGTSRGEAEDEAPTRATTRAKSPTRSAPVRRTRK